MQLDQAFAELNIVQDFIPAGNSNRPGRKLTPTAITIHNTDNDSVGANEAAHAKYQKGADARKREVSWHFTVDDKSVYQSLPTNEIGWHAGSSAGNASSIGIEICMNADLDVPPPINGPLCSRPSWRSRTRSECRARSSSIITGRERIAPAS
jgi:N-acetyl-anhydromuramyl-L-alanine amidase AmpD